MASPLQAFEFFKSRYETPTQRWLCGWAAGKACGIGPDQKGRCRATYECSPSRDGDRWGCTRVRTAGGDCEGGPLPDGTCSRPIPPCQPVLSIRAKRGRVALWATGLTFALMLALLGGPLDQSDGYLRPGSLASQHAALTCASCHIAAAVGTHGMGWMSFAFASERGVDSQLCLKCHRSLGSYALNDHGSAPGLLVESSQHVEPMVATGFLAAMGLGGPSNERGEVACATCHREHQADSTELVDRDDMRCQSCHSSQFASFTAGHPEFAAYPQKRRTRIAFDHSSHLGHFIEKDEAFECVGCHELDPTGHDVTVGRFESSCARCHAEAIEENAASISFLTIPVIHVEALRDRGFSIGRWPADAYGEEEYEGEWTPFMRLLIAGDQTYPNLQEDLGVLSDLDLYDLTEATDEELQAVVRMARSVKALLKDLTGQGHGAVKERLERVLERPIGHQTLAALTSRLPTDLVHAAQKKWMPDLMDKDASKEDVPITDVPSPATTADESAGARTSAGGWYREEIEDLSFRYRPAGHEDTFLRAWLDLAGELGGGIAAADEIFEVLSGRRLGGTCTKCHSVDRDPEGEPSDDPGSSGGEIRRVNWQGTHRGSGERAFTDFVHEPHLVKACQHCHVPSGDYEKNGFRKSFERTDPTGFVPNYAAMTISTCAECHTEGKTQAGCLTCHNYHVGTFDFMATKTTATEM